MTTTPHQGDFQPHVGKLFHFDGWHGTLRLALIETGPETGTQQATRVPFTLIFHGPRNDILPEGFRSATAETGERFALYVMPIHTIPSDRQDYQAVFN